MKVLNIGQKGKNLKIGRYKKISTKFDFPKISDLAFDIEYLYRYDGYLPSFIFNLRYKIPKNSKIECFEKLDNGIIKLQNYIEMENFYLVRYTEFEDYAA